jgi:hypothetical protein
VQWDQHRPIPLSWGAVVPVIVRHVVTDAHPLLGPGVYPSHISCQSWSASAVTQASGFLGIVVYHFLSFFPWGCRLQSIVYTSVAPPVPDFQACRSLENPVGRSATTSHFKSLYIPLIWKVLIRHMLKQPVLLFWLHLLAFKSINLVGTPFLSLTGEAPFHRRLPFLEQLSSAWVLNTLPHFTVNCWPS